MDLLGMVRNLQGGNVNALAGLYHWPGAGGSRWIMDNLERLARESGGTGLGLSIAREIALRHDGSLTLESELGKGTVITLTLPVEGPAHG